jgi:hypothetical protein
MGGIGKSFFADAQLENTVREAIITNINFSRLDFLKLASLGSIFKIIQEQNLKVFYHNVNLYLLQTALFLLKSFYVYYLFVLKMLKINIGGKTCPL